MSRFCKIDQSFAKKLIPLRYKSIIMKKFLLSGSLLLILTTQINAQLTVTAELDDETFIYSLAGPGIVVSGIERNCAEGASGFFNSMDANVGIENGMLLTSGLADGAIGPNDEGSYTMYNGTDGDDDLTAAAGYPTYDACVIEFDMTVAADTLKLSYVFGSEEYMEFAGTGFNDIFAFWVSGPDILVPVNIAKVPGTDLPVAINNVNAFTNADYFVHNGDGYEAPYNTDDMYVQYDGLTTILLAHVPVTAGETYHMKIAIADGSDAIFDSGVFLETGSLGSLRMKHETLADNELTYAVEKCATGYFKFTNEVPCAEPLVLDYYIAGSATNGVDYEMIPEQLIIPAWDSVGIIEIVPLHDAVAESFESVELYLYNPQSGFIYDTLTILIDDELELNGYESVTDGLEIQFTETAGEAVTWLWEFGDGGTSNLQSPTHIFAAPGEYSVCLTITDASGCEDKFCKTVEAGSVGINNTPSSDFVVSPNPTQNNITIEIPVLLSGDVEVSIKNVLGQTMLSQVANANMVTVEMDLSDLSSGLYFIELRSEGKTFVKQIEKE